MLRAAEWQGTAPLVDPMCGAGTIPIEAALIARRIPPGINRDFAFLGWPGADTERWTTLVEHGRAQALKSSPVRIAGSDRDAGAIDAAKANAERAGVAGDITFAVQSVSAATSVALSVAKGPVLPTDDTPFASLRATGGLLITNPPYGERIGDSDAIRNLYAQTGNVARKAFAGWTFGMLSPSRALDTQTRLPLEERFATSNGGIPVRFVSGPIPA
jgi:putative N6-adenine-specific DNA methylase